MKTLWIAMCINKESSHKNKAYVLDSSISKEKILKAIKNDMLSWEKHHDASKVELDFKNMCAFDFNKMMACEWSIDKIQIQFQLTFE